MKSDHLSISRVGQINSDDKDTYRLAFTHSLMTPEHDADFALGYAATVESSEYNDVIKLAKPQECRMAKPKPDLQPEQPPDPQHRIPQDRLPYVRAGFVAYILARRTEAKSRVREERAEGEENEGQQTDP